VRQILSLVATAVVLTIAALAAQEPGAILFKSGVERVAVSAVVRDSRGKLVKNLEARDFQLFDEGRVRPLLSVWSEPSPSSVAVLMDASGSMATKLERARDTARTLVAGLKPGIDEVAYYTFDTALEQVRPFSKSFSITDVPLDGTKAFGATSLWDAIAATAQRMSDRQQRRALVVITDGVDSASKLKPAAVSAIASELDVPVYVLVITFSLEEDPREITSIQGPLTDLAAWTGGDSLQVRDLESAALATSQILAELDHQYMIAFEPGRTPGWHPLVVKSRKPGLFVRARSGYTVK
jgi:Ca-activated chloride channel family protein